LACLAAQTHKTIFFCFFGQKGGPRPPY
jgi:hypothetical protein